MNSKTTIAELNQSRHKNPATYHTYSLFVLKGQLTTSPTATPWVNRPSLSKHPERATYELDTFIELNKKIQSPQSFIERKKMSNKTVLSLLKVKL